MVVSPQDKFFLGCFDGRGICRGCTARPIQAAVIRNINTTDENIKNINATIKNIEPP